LSVELASRGYSLALWDINMAGLEGTVELATVSGGGALRTYQVDVADGARVAEAVDQVEEDLGHIDVLVSNAGVVNPPRLIKEGNLELWSPVIAVNAMGTLNVVQTVFPRMAASKKGLVMFNSSVTGLRVLENHVVYGATKHFIEGLAKGLRMEGLRDGVRVSVVRPSAIETNLSRSAIETNLSRRPEEGGGDAESHRVQAEVVADITKLGLPWVMNPGDVAAQMANIIDLPDSMVVNELTLSAQGFPAL